MAEELSEILTTIVSTCGAAEAKAVIAPILLDVEGANQQVRIRAVAVQTAARKFGAFTAGLLWGLKFIGAKSGTAFVNKSSPPAAPSGAVATTVLDAGTLHKAVEAPPTLFKLVWHHWRGVEGPVRRQTRAL